MIERYPDNDAYRRGVELHKSRAQMKALPHYESALRENPDRPPTDREVELIRAHAPRLFTTPTEPLPLMHVVTLLHPDEPLIAYHFFWEDDIDFPDDGEPCDHEVFWVRYDPDAPSPSERVTGVYTYYHGHVLEAPKAPQEAASNEGRPRADVQWGKHGTLPYGWRDEPELVANMRKTYERLSTRGIRTPDHPVAATWPKRFSGEWSDFVDFSLEVDLQKRLERSVMAVGTLGNAIIATRFLTINFAAKFSWPDLEQPGGGIY